MRKNISQEPALARYIPLVTLWVKRAWLLYRFFELLEHLANVVF